MKKSYRCFAALGLCVSLITSPILTPITAFAVSSERISRTEQNNNGTVIDSNNLSREDYEFFRKLEKVFPYFSESNGVYSFDLTDLELKENYSYSDEDVSRIHKLISDMNRVKSYYQSNPTIYKDRVYVDNWKIYFNYDETTGLLLSAAQAGVPALVAALTALGSVYPGVGNILGLITGLWSGGSLAYTIIQAAAMHKGVYIGVDWNGPFPLPAMGTW